MYDREPFFIVDEYQDEFIKLQKEVNSLLKKDFVYNDPKAIVLKKFVYELIKASRKLKYHNAIETSTLDIKRPLETEENIVEQNTQPLIVAKDTEKVLVKKFITNKNNIDIYNVIEPRLNEEEKIILDNLSDTDLRETTREQLMYLIKQEALKINIDFNELLFEKIRYYLIRNLIGYGKIDPLLNDENIKVVTIDVRQAKVLYNNKEMYTNIIFNDNEEINELIKKIGSRNNVKVDDSEPVLDVISEFGRVQATLGNNFINPKLLIRKS
mgnify:CR=1 FL=1